VSRAPVLRGCGGLRDDGPAVALVGSRAASALVLERAAGLARAAAEQGISIVSGGALGVDGAAHRGALAGGGHTVVVLGTGLDVPYPDRHRGLFDEIVAAGGALVSRFPDDATPRPGNFVARNRIVAGLADLVVVVGAERGSGSLHTARAAVELGRRLAAVPGTAGTDALLAAGAALVEREADLALALAGTPRAPIRRALDDAEAAVIAALDCVAPRAVDELADTLQLRLPVLLGLLLGLEVAGWVVPVAGGCYLRARS